MRYRVDATWERPSPRVVMAGSPMRLFRVTDAGARLCDRLEDGGNVADSTLTDRLVDAGAIHPVPPHEAAPVAATDVPIITPQLGGPIALADRDITVDDGSDVPVEGAHVRLDENRGPAAARNAGRRAIFQWHDDDRDDVDVADADPPGDPEFIAFVDADVVLDRGWLDGLLPHFADERVALVAPRVVGDPSASLDLGAEPARISAGTRVSYVPAAAIVVRTAAFDEIGGFDEALRFGEDVDLVWRLDEAGWRCRYEPSVTVAHTPRERLAGRVRQQVGYGSAAAPLALRHPRSLAPLRANGWMVGTWASANALWPLGAITGIAGNVWSLHRGVPGLGARRAMRLVVDHHLAGLGNLADAIRRVWWPIALAASLVSRRMRVATMLAFAVGARRAITDLAYGWGVWSGVRRHRTLRPITPHISGWDADGRRLISRRRTRASAPRPAAAAR